ncbi:MAG: HD domain-containing protein [Archaeoglobaceae archaeon]
MGEGLSVLGVVLVFLGIVMIVLVLRRGSGEREVFVGGRSIEVELEKLGVIWRGKERVEVAIEELARIWKTQEEDASEVLGEEVEFRSDELMEFYLVYLRGRKWFRGRVREVILEVMRILDEKGGVPSVVDRDGVELGEDIYGILKRVSLREHSVRVARKVFEMGVSGIREPQAVLCALAHDLGKIPEYQGKYYSLGDHPVISVTVLKGIELFRGLSFAEEVEKAILYHHRTGKGELVEILKKADRLAREEEVRLYEGKRYEGKKSERGQVDEGGSEMGSKVKQEKVSGEVERRVESKVEERVESVEYRDIEDREEREERGRVEGVDLSWLDIERFMSVLKEKVNVVERGKWIAVSDRDGVVYVHPQGLWEIVKRLALEEKRIDVVLMEGDRKMKRSVLVELVRLLREAGYIDKELIQEGYFASPFKVYKDGEVKRVLYTPFCAGVFGLVSELEMRKRGTILEKIEKIEPDYSAFEESKELLSS